MANGPITVNSTSNIASKKGRVGQNEGKKQGRKEGRTDCTGLDQLSDGDMYLRIERRGRMAGSAVVRPLPPRFSSPASKPLSRRSGMGGMAMMKSGRPTGAGLRQDPEETTDEVVEKAPCLDATEAFSVE